MPQKDDAVFSRPVKTFLTDVVVDLRADWVARPARQWDRIYSIRDIATTDLDKRVAAALCEGFVQFSNFLCFLEILMLQRVQGSAEFKETLLCVEKFFAHCPHYFRGLDLISDGQGALAKVDSAVDSAHGATDQRKIHADSPYVGKDGVGAADSTFSMDFPTVDQEIHHD